MNFFSVSGDGRVTNWTIVKAAIRKEGNRIIWELWEPSLAMDFTTQMIKLEMFYLNTIEQLFLFVEQLF